MKGYQFYSVNEYKPSGWLYEQLLVQARGLSGHLDKMWPDIRDSAWVGGDREGWERVPYWLDGLIPLAYLLEDQELIASAKRYMDAILERQDPDGWICPCDRTKISEYDTWAVQLISKVLVVYYESARDERVPDALYRMMHNYYDLLTNKTIHLFGWGKYRWFECLIALNFLADRFAEPWITELAELLAEQGFDYTTAQESWKTPLNWWRWETHGVNLAMMLKIEAVTQKLLPGRYNGQAEQLYTQLMRYNGTPAGIFTADECLSGLSPIQGTELCAVVEWMYSMEHLYAYSGDGKWADRLEQVAFNALPATFSDDMWAHQYVQMSNQICVQKFPGKSLFRTNNDEAHLFGLEPHYGCCTANLSQGWPKLALSSFMHRGDEVVSVVPVPGHLCADGISVSLATEYPFKQRLTYTVDPGKAFTLRVRVPSFVKGLTVNGETVALTDALTFAIEANRSYEIQIAFAVEPRVIKRPHDLYTMAYGSLIFSLPVAYEKQKREYERGGVVRKYPYCDYEYLGRSEWRYGLCKGEAEVQEYDVSACPFSSEHPPLTLKVTARPVSWPFEDGYLTVAAKRPADNKPCGEATVLQLYPYGCAKLRVTELPFCQE